MTNKKRAGNRRTVQQESIVNGSELWGRARRGSVPVLREFFRCRSGRLCHPGTGVNKGKLMRALLLFTIDTSSRLNFDLRHGRSLFLVTDRQGPARPLRVLVIFRSDRPSSRSILASPTKPRTTELEATLRIPSMAHMALDSLFSFWVLSNKGIHAYRSIESASIRA